MKNDAAKFRPGDTAVNVRATHYVNVPIGSKSQVYGIGSGCLGVVYESQKYIVESKYFDKLDGV